MTDFDDEFAGFDPQKYWATLNRDDVVAKPKMGRLDQVNIDLLIPFLSQHRTILEIMAAFKFKRGQTLKLLSFIKAMRGISVECHNNKGKMFYLVTDLRKKS